MWEPRIGPSDSPGVGSTTSGISDGLLGTIVCTLRDVRIIYWRGIMDVIVVIGLLLIYVRLGSILDKLRELNKEE